MDSYFSVVLSVHSHMKLNIVKGEVEMENKIEKHQHKDVVVTRNSNGELVVTSRQVAEDFGKQHQHVTQAIENLISENSLLKSMMMESEYTTERGRKYKEYLLTRDGFSLLVMGFTGAKALEWKLKYIEAFNKMEQVMKNPYGHLSKELQAIFMLDQKTVEIDNRVTKLENTMTIDFGQQEVIQRVAKERLVEVLGGKDTPAYRELSKKVFSNLWKRYKQVFHVASYKDTAKKDYEEAINYIEKWEPSKELGYMITGANSQIQFNN